MTTNRVQGRVAMPQKRTAPATPKKKSTLTKEEKRAGRSEVNANIDRIQDCYRIGSAILKACPCHARPGVIKELAKRHRIPEGAARRYRQIAKMYSQRELDALYKQFRSRNFAYKITHFFVLIGVSDPKIRKKLSQVAVRKKLNIAQLRKMKFKMADSPTGSGGRMPDVVNQVTKEDLHAAIHFETAKWGRWLNHLLGKSRNIEPSLEKRLFEVRKLVQKIGKLSAR